MSKASRGGRREWVPHSHPLPKNCFFFHGNDTFGLFSCVVDLNLSSITHRSKILIVRGHSPMSHLATRLVPKHVYNVTAKVY